MTPTDEPSIADIMADIGYPAGAGFVDMVRHMAAADPDLPAVEFGDTVIGYGELLRMIAGAAGHLENLGVRRGDRVAYMVTGHPNSLVTYLAVITAGAVLVPIYNELNGEVLVDTLRRYDVSVMVLDPELRPLVEPLVGRIPELRHVVDVRDSPYAEEIARGGDISVYLERDFPTAADPAVILSTSGTTGTPKGVVQYGAFCLGSYVAFRKWNLEFPVKGYFCTSWGHGTVLFMSSLAFWTHGSIVLAERFSASRFMSEVRRYRCTYVHLVGTMQRALFNQPPTELDRDHDIRLCMSAGMPVDIWEDFSDRFGVDVYEVYSATDSGGSWITNPARYPKGSIGRPWVETEARVTDADGIEVPDGTVGELELRPRGRAGAVSYYDDRAASAEKVREGWVRMGDYVTRDSDGNFWFVDRKRDVIRRRGINIAPKSIEDALCRNARVRDVCAIAVPDDMGEDEIKAVLIPADARLTHQEIADFATDVLPKHMRPRYIEFVSDFPRTSGTERVKRFLFRERWRTPTTWDSRTGAFNTLDEVR